MARRSLASGVAIALFGVSVGFAPAAEATWGTLALRPPPAKIPDQSWLADLPEKPGAHSRGKIAVFAFRGDDVYQPLRETVVRMLRRRGYNVTVTLRPPEGAVEYRETSVASNTALFVSGEMIGEGARQRATIHLHSGLTGHRMASMSFVGPTEKIVGDVTHKWWTRVAPTILRTCTAASRPRQHERAPLLIDAGDP